jgi:hypothetical protein
MGSAQGTDLEKAGKALKDFSAYPDATFIV